MSSDVGYNGRVYRVYAGTQNVVLRCPDCGKGQMGVPFSQYAAESQRWKFACSHCGQCLFPLIDGMEELWINCGPLWDEVREFVPSLQRYTPDPLLESNADWRALYYGLRVSDPDLHRVAWGTWRKQLPTKLDGLGLVRVLSEEQATAAEAAVRKRRRQPTLVDKSNLEEGTHVSTATINKLIHTMVVSQCAALVSMEIKHREEIDPEDCEIGELLEQLRGQTKIPEALPYSQEIVDFAVESVLSQVRQLRLVAAERIDE